MSSKLIKLFDLTASYLPENSKIHNDCVSLKKWYTSEGTLTYKQMTYLRSMINTALFHKSLEAEFDLNLKEFLNLEESKQIIKLVV